MGTVKEQRQPGLEQDSLPDGAGFYNLLLTCVEACPRHSAHVEVSGQLLGVGFLLLSWEWNSGYHAYVANAVTS